MTTMHYKEYLILVSYIVVMDVICMLLIEREPNIVDITFCSHWGCSCTGRPFHVIYPTVPPQN